MYNKRKVRSKTTTKRGPKLQQKNEDIFFPLPPSNTEPCRARTDQMLLRMKKSWMKMQPKGSTPPMMMPGKGRVYRDWSGIWRGIWFVRTGCSMGWQQVNVHHHHSVTLYHRVSITIILSPGLHHYHHHMDHIIITQSPVQHHHLSIRWTAPPLYHLVSIIIITWMGSSCAYYLDCINTLAEQHH